MNRLEKVLRKAIEKNGWRYQLMIVVEELSELTKEISKVYRGEGKKENVIEEMADVIITMGYVREILDIKEDEISEIVKRKISRLEEKLWKGQHLQKK